MGALTEPEIFDCLADNLRKAIDLCEIMAKRPLRGEPYRSLVKSLKLIEGCCKQAAVWREDARWLPIGQKMGRIHQSAGDLLRGVKMPNGMRRRIRDGEMHPAFVMLADVLRGLLILAEITRTKKVGVLHDGYAREGGAILPVPQRGPHRDTVPVGWRKTEAGIVVPQGAMAQ